MSCRILRASEVRPDPDRGKHDGEASERREDGVVTEQVPWNVEDREASAFLRIGFKICLNKNLDSLVAGVDFDADWCIAEIHFVSATIPSPDDRVRHLRPAPCDSVVCC